MEVGKGVNELKEGDRVSIECVYFCNKCYYCTNKNKQTHLCEKYEELGFTLGDGKYNETIIIILLMIRLGGYSSFIEVEEEKAHKFNNNLSFELAALTEPAAVAGISSSSSFLLLLCFSFLLLLFFFFFFFK